MSRFRCFSLFFVVFRCLSVFFGVAIRCFSVFFVVAADLPNRIKLGRNLPNIALYICSPLFACPNLLKTNSLFNHFCSFAGFRCRCPCRRRFFRGHWCVSVESRCFSFGVRRYFHFFARPAGRPASRPTGRVTGGVPEQSRNLLFFCEGVLEQLSGPRFVVCSLFRCRFSLFFPVCPCFVVAFRRFSLSLPWGSIFFVRSCLHNKK